MTNEDIKKICRQIVLTLRAECDSKVGTATGELKTYADSATSTHNSATDAHTDIRTSISELATRLNALADSDDVTLDQMSEVVTYIRSNRTLLEGITTGKINTTDIIDALDSSATNKPLSANQGRVLNEKIAGKVSSVEGKGLSTNDYTDTEKDKLAGITAGAEPNVQSDWNATESTAANFIKNKPASMPASDVYDWAKAETKPGYTKGEVGLGNVDNTADADKPVSTAQATAIAAAVAEHNISETAHDDIRTSLTALTERLNALAGTDSSTLDQLSELVSYINSNKDVVDAITTSKVNVSDIVDGLESTATNKPLSANQGRILDEKVAGKVDKVDGKGLSTNDYTNNDKQKLSGIPENAAANVQADWGVTDTGSDAYIKNKPTSMPASDVHDWAKAETKPTYTKDEVGLDHVDNTSDINKPVSTAQATAIAAAVSAHDSADTAHADIREFVTTLSTRLTTLADSDDVTLDQMSELVAYIKNNRSLIDSVTTAKINVSDIIDALNSTATNKPLSANQGKILNDKVEGKVTKVEGKVLSSNDYTDEDKQKLAGISAGAEANVQADWSVTDETAANFIANKPTSMPASDVPAWAKNATKPEYTKDEVGLGNVDNTADADKPVSTAQQAAIDEAVSAHNSAETAHTDIRNTVANLVTRLNTIANSDDETLDQMSELVDYIKSNRELIDGVTTGKINTADIVDALDSSDTKKPLSANQGRILDEKIAGTVKKVEGKVLSSNDYTDEDKQKLAGITAGAKPNVQSDWNVTDIDSDAYIKNKPTSMPASDVYAWAKGETKPAYTKAEVGLDHVDNTADADKPVSTAQATAISTAVTEHNNSESAHDDIRTLIAGISTRLNALADSDDTTLDQMSEIVEYIKSNRTLIDNITTGKVSTTDIVDSLTSTATNKPLSAKQGKILNEKIDGKVTKVEGKVLSSNDYTDEDKQKLAGITAGAKPNVQSDWKATDVNSDAYIKNKPTSMPASDVYSWAKAETKPAYTKAEVGLGNVPNLSTDNLTPTCGMASARSALLSGDTLKTIMGKLNKWYRDLKTVAFTGKYSDLSGAPSVEKHRNYKQCTTVCSFHSSVRYVRVAYINPATNDTGTNFGVVLRVTEADYMASYQADIHVGMGAFSGGDWIDKGGFTVMNLWNKHSIQNLATTLANKFVMVADPIDGYCSDIWVKLSSTDKMHIEIVSYAEYNAGANSDDTPTYANIQAYSDVDCYQHAIAVPTDNLMYLDHIPTAADYQLIYPNCLISDDPVVLAGSWT